MKNRHTIFVQKPPEKYLYGIDGRGRIMLTIKLRYVNIRNGKCVIGDCGLCQLAGFSISSFGSSSLLL